jgi:hypothetical protein
MAERHWLYFQASSSCTIAVLLPMNTGKLNERLLSGKPHAVRNVALWVVIARGGTVRLTGNWLELTFVGLSGPVVGENAY